MRASNASATSFAANRTFRAFLGVYLLMSLFILVLIGSIYFEYRKNSMLSDHRLAMQLQSETYIPRVKVWLAQGGTSSDFPKDIAYNTAVYGSNEQPIVSLLIAKELNVKDTLGLKNGYVHYVIDLASYEMGNRYLVFETKDDGLWLEHTLKIMGLSGSLIFIMLFLLGLYISTLILKPMREALSLLDGFIQDTTHELNTPVSAIMTNIEALDVARLDEKSAKKIRRIDIAARTISTIYDDLTYLILNHDVVHKDEVIDMKLLIHERLEYFKHRYKQKEIRVTTEIETAGILVMDRIKLTRIIDNLLSNAIKYNHQKGHIEINFSHKRLSVSNSGRGIAKEKMHQIFERYQRADRSVGGFGLGLHIVAMIAREYSVSIEVDSELDAMTTIRLQWP